MDETDGYIMKWKDTVNNGANTSLILALLFLFFATFFDYKTTIWQLSIMISLSFAGFSLGLRASIGLMKEILKE